LRDVTYHDSSLQSSSVCVIRFFAPFRSLNNRNQYVLLSNYYRMEKTVCLSRKDLCLKILGSHISIRFVAIVTSSGKILATEYRKNVVPLLSDKELIVSVVYSVISIRSIKAIQKKLGRIACSFILYEKVALATLPLQDNSYLMLSFDRRSVNHQSIILDNVIPILQKHKLA
jgi:hypothetical protein